MKTNKFCVAVIFIFAIFSGLSIANVKASVEYEGDNGYVETNVALNNANWSFKDLSGNPVTYASFTGDELTPACLTNGTNNPFNGTLYVSNGSSGIAGWAILDLGNEFTITKLQTSFWHDHSNVDVVIQVATDADFTQGLMTLFNNDTNNSVGQGLGANIAYQDISGSYQTIEFAPVVGRYLRVTNVDTERTYTILNEIQVFAATSGIIPVTANRGFRFVENNFDLVLSTPYENASIYYTTDGSYPTTSSTLYESAIDTVSLGSKFAIRAIVSLEDKSVSIPVTMKYELIQKNVCLGKTATFTKDTAAFQGSATAAFVTDGAFSPYNVWGSIEGESNLCFAIVDFGEEYSIGKVTVKLFHDWYFSDVVIQLSTKEDFSENVYTVYNNDWDHNVTTEPTTANATTTYYAENPAEGHTFEFAPVRARYIRVYNMTVQNASRYSVWEDIQAYNYVDASAIYPTMTQAIKSAESLVNFTVAYGLPIADLLNDPRLPKSFEVVDFDGNAVTVNGTWTYATYDSEVAGDYTFQFVTEPGSNLVDSFEILKSVVKVSAQPDRSALSARLTVADELIEAHYTSTSWPAFASAKADSHTVFDQTVVLQEDIDKADLALQNAMNALELRGNKTELNALLAVIDGLSETNYTVASWSALQAKKSEVVTVQNDVDAVQSTVDLALADLNSVYSALSLVGNKTALQARYAELSVIVNQYTSITWMSFVDALEAASAVLEKTEPTVAEVEDALSLLNLRYTQLVQKADFSALQTLVTELNSLNHSLYTPTTIAALETEISRANTILADDTTAQTAIDTELAALTVIKDGLLLKGDKATLAALVNEAVKTEASYTATSYAAYYLAYENAIAVNQNENAVQTEVDLAVTNLTAAINALVDIANKTELNQLIENAKTLVQDDYELVSFEVLQQAIEYAESVSKSNDVDQKDADDAKILLQTAMDQLAEKKPDSIFSCKSAGILHSFEFFGLIALAFAFFIYKRK